MKDPFICHPLIVSIASPRTATWNVDEWRRGGRWGTVKGSCNPGGAR